MAKKIINLIIVRADRQEWDGDSADFLVMDLSHAPIKILKAVQLQPQSHNVKVVLDDLPLDLPGQLYGLSLDAPDHRITYQLINRDSIVRNGAEQEDVIVRMMLVPNDPTSSDIAGGYGRLRDKGSPVAADDTGLTEQQYAALDPIAKKMALLNPEAKLRDTNVNGASLLSFVEGVRHVAVDRIFLFVSEELKGMIAGSHDFGKAQGHAAPSADEAPPELHLPAHPKSWKHTRFDTGNVQLSFSEVVETLPNTTKRVFSLDVDIDLEKDLGHVLEFLDNKIHPGKKTDQTLVYSLLFPQGITPYYTLDPLLG
jgi:hypothetical protein